MGLESVGGRTATSGLIQDNSTREDGLGKKEFKKNNKYLVLRERKGGEVVDTLQILTSY